MSWQSAEPPPAILVLPPDAASLDEAHAAIELWEFYSGKTLDSTQRLAVEVMMAETSSGRWAARTTGREMPRQNGKGDEIEVVELWGLVQRGEMIGHTAHELKTVASAHERMVSLLSHRDLDRKVAKVLNGIGQQRIYMHNGAEIMYATRTKGGLRGLDDISRIVVDEAQHAQREQLASSTPTMLANPNPQMNFIGTGAIAGTTTWWWEIRKRALSADPGAFGYVGHTAEVVTLSPDGKVIQSEIDPSDQSLWFATNPALHAGRGEIEFFEEQYRTLGPALFAREHLGVWDPPEDEFDGGPISLDQWRLLEVPRSTAETHKTWGLAVSPQTDKDGRPLPVWWSLGKSGRNPEGRYHVEWMEHRPGTHTLVDVVAEHYASNRTPLRVPNHGPSKDWIPRLRERGVEVVEVSTSEMQVATGQFVEAVRSGQLAHIGQPSLDKSLTGAKVATTADGAMVWSQRSSSVEITPLVAVTVALGGVPAATAAEWTGSLTDLSDLLDQLDDEEII